MPIIRACVRLSRVRYFRGQLTRGFLARPILRAEAATPITDGNVRDNACKGVRGTLGLAFAVEWSRSATTMWVGVHVGIHTKFQFSSHGDIVSLTFSGIHHLAGQCSVYFAPRPLARRRIRQHERANSFCRLMVAVEVRDCQTRRTLSATRAGKHGRGAIQDQPRGVSH